MRETSAGGNGVAVDSTVYTVVLTVTDNRDGTLSVSEAVTDAAGAEVDATAADGLPFTNTYTATPTSATLGVAKTLSGRDWADDDAFAFTLAGVDGAPLPEEAGRTAQATRAAQAATFGAIPFEFADLGGATSKTFYYEISEENGGTTVDNLAYDTPKQARVTVADDGKGALSASAPEYSADGKTWAAAEGGAAFTNVYAPPEEEDKPAPEPPDSDPGKPSNKLDKSKKETEKETPDEPDEPTPPGNGTPGKGSGSSTSGSSSPATGDVLLLAAGLALLTAIVSLTVLLAARR